MKCRLLRCTLLYLLACDCGFAASFHGNDDLRRKLHLLRRAEYFDALGGIVTSLLLPGKASAAGAVVKAAGTMNKLTPMMKKVRALVVSCRRCEVEHHDRSASHPTYSCARRWQTSFPEPCPTASWFFGSDGLWAHEDSEEIPRSLRRLSAATSSVGSWRRTCLTHLVEACTFAWEVWQAFPLPASQDSVR
jgi:hypothetical protein